MTFTSKKEADAYDKMLDIAEALESMLSEVDVPLSEQQSEALALEMAKRKEQFIAALKGGKPTPPSTKGKVTDIKKVS